MDALLDLGQLFRPDLLKDEKVLWTGQPDRHSLLTGADLFLIPFSLLWGGFAIVWEAGVLGFFSKGEAAPILFAVWGIPFVLVGQYFIWGRFVYKAWSKRRTAYAVTNRRVLVLTTTGGRRLQSAFISQIPTINKTVRGSGLGTLEFGPLAFGARLAVNSGMEFLGHGYRSAYPAFYDVPGVERVYELVTRLRLESEQRADPAV